MDRSGPTRLSRGVLVLLACLLVLGQTAALASQFESHHSAEHCCMLCHVGALPFLQVAVASTLAPVFRKVWLAPRPETTTVREAAHVIQSSRAPPTFAESV